MKEKDNINEVLIDTTKDDITKHPKFHSDIIKVGDKFKIEGGKEGTMKYTVVDIKECEENENWFKQFSVVNQYGKLDYFTSRSLDEMMKRDDPFW